MSVYNIIRRYITGLHRRKNTKTISTYDTFKDKKARIFNYTVTQNDKISIGFLNPVSFIKILKLF